jgi:hypothetical protein
MRSGEQRRAAATRLRARANARSFRIRAALGCEGGREALGRERGAASMEVLGAVTGGGHLILRCAAK